MSFRRAEQIRRRLSAAAGGSFTIVYEAMCECAQKAKSNLLDEADVLAAIERRLTAPSREDSPHGRE